ncbi:MAG: TonB family protein [Pseudomonadota bacterium]
MTTIHRYWLLALIGSATLHFALFVGFSEITSGAVKKPAGKPVTSVASLAGVLGAPTSSHNASQATADPAPTPPTKTVKPNVAKPLEPVRTATARPVASPKAVSASSPTQSSPEARSTTTAPVVAAEAAEAKPVERLASAAPVKAQPTERSKPDNTTEPKVQPAEAVENSAKRVPPTRTETPPKTTPKVQPKRRAKPRKRQQRSSRARRAGNARQGAAGASRGGRRGRRSASAGAVASYAARVRARILANRPRGVARGRVVVSFGLSTGGGLRYARVSRSSGSAAVDRAALAAVRRSSPFPRPPAGASSRQLRYSIAFTFR